MPQQKLPSSDVKLLLFLILALRLKKDAVVIEENPSFSSIDANEQPEMRFIMSLKLEVYGRC